MHYQHRHYTHLTSTQATQFMTHGFLRLRNCWSRAANDKLVADLWRRLDATGGEGREREITYLPATHSFLVSDFSPRAWGAICEVLGGGERVSEDSNWWDDGFIVNLGRKRGPSEEEDEGEGEEEKDGGVRKAMRGRRLGDADGFHVDGDFFVHYLDSPEQGLLVVPIFSDILEGAGGTVIAPDSIGKIAKWLYDHPGGVTPNMIPYHGSPRKNDFEWCGELAEPEDRYYECSGEVGDVLLLHPLMLHSAYQNFLRLPRIIINACIQLKEPFNFNRSDPDDYSLVELKTLQELGKDRLDDWRIQGPRKTYDAVEAERIDQRWRDKLEILRNE